MMSKHVVWLAALPLALLMACQQAPTEVPMIPTEEPMEVEVAPTEEPPEAADAGSLYYSEVGDFCLNVPSSWEGRHEVEELRGADAVALFGTATSVTTFNYTPTDPAMAAAAIATILTMSKADYDAIDSTQQPPPGTLIAEEGDRVWLFAGPQSNPYDLTSPDGLTFDAMYATLGDIATRFNTGPCAAASGATGGLPEEVAGVAWQWTSTLMSDGSTSTPADPSQYTVAFAADGTVSVQADCNMAAGTYEADGTTVTIALGPMTMAMCAEGSLSDVFVQQLSQVGSWMMQEGELVLLLQVDSGSMMFSSP